MKVVAVEDLVAMTILTFCENAAELGCPRDKDVDMWYRYLSIEEQRKVADKLLDIDARNYEMIENDKKTAKKKKRGKK